VLGYDPIDQAMAIKDRIGVCLQATNLPEKLQSSKRFELFAAFYSRNTDRNRLLERLQLSEKRNASYSTLSGGQKQRLALAWDGERSATGVSDEPTTGLDPQVRLEIHS